MLSDGYLEFLNKKGLLNATSEDGTHALDWNHGKG
jgi:hypothetical protein